MSRKMNCSFGFFSIFLALANVACANYLVSLRDGYLPISDARIIEIDNNGNFVRNVVAPGASSLISPSGMKIGPDGLLYVTDAFSNSIQKFNPVTGAPAGTISTPSGSPTILNGPTDLAWGSDGNLYVTNLGFSLSASPLPYTGTNVSKFDGVTGAPIGDFFAVPTTLTGGFAIGPSSIVFDASGNAYVAEISPVPGVANQVVKLSSAGAPLEFITSSDFSGPSNLSWSPSGNLLITSVVNGNILEYNPTTDATSLLLSLGSTYFPTVSIYSDATHILVGGSPAAGDAIDKYLVGGGAPTHFPFFSQLVPGFGPPGFVIPGDGITIGAIVPFAGVPEPTTWLLLVVGCSGLACIRRRS